MKPTWSRSRGGLTLIEILIVITIMSVLLALAVPALLASQLASNERAILATIKTVAVANYDFRGNDRDGNGISDFWTGDVSGLFSMTSAAIPGFNDSVIKLIELPVALADSAPLAAGQAGGELQGISAFGAISNKSGFWIAVLDTDAQTGEDYQTSTGGTPLMGDVHHNGKFGIIAYPDAYGASGKVAVILNEQGVVYRRHIQSSIKPAGGLTPPGPLTNASYKDWPSDQNIKSYWSKTD